MVGVVVLWQREKSRLRSQFWGHRKPHNWSLDGCTAMQLLSLVLRLTAPLSHYTYTHVHDFTHDFRECTNRCCLRFVRGNGAIAFRGPTLLFIVQTWKKAHNCVRRNRRKNVHSRNFVCFHARGPVGFNQYYQLERERRTLGALRPTHRLSSYACACEWSERSSTLRSGSICMWSVAIGIGLPDVLF